MTFHCANGLVVLRICEVAHLRGDVALLVAPPCKTTQCSYSHHNYGWGSDLFRFGPTQLLGTGNRAWRRESEA